MTIRNFKSSVSLGTSDTPDPKDPSAFPTEPTLPQSGSMLPLEYDDLLAFVFDKTRRSQHDPLSDLIPLFAHAAFAEVQFLNMIEHQTLTGIDDLKGEPDDTALANLQYLASVLDRHAKQLKGTIRAINNLTEISKVIKESTTGESSLEQKEGPQKSPNKDRIFIKSRTNSWTSRYGAIKGTFTVKGLLEDYEDLLARDLKLSEQCTAGITVTMNRVMIQESRKAIEQSERVKRLTLLATLFIPLTFSSSLFSMDLELFEQEPRKIWWYIVVCIPITLLTYVWFIWDFAAIRRMLSRFSRRKKALGPGSIHLENI
jgi:CorA-like Mg2+ transporter protein